MPNGFFTDTTLCIGCKACEVACKQWNQLPADGYEFTGMSLDNTVSLGATTWRHVAFIEQLGGQDGHDAHDGQQRQADAGAQAIGGRMDQRMNSIGGTGGVGLATRTDVVGPATGGLLGEHRWLMMSDVCKHCTNAGCLDACPTGAIIRNEFGDVYVQPDICNGCGYCVPSCPFGVISINENDGRAWKCTLCYDRQKEGLTPACAQACPTQSILFGDVDELRQRAEERVGMLHQRGITSAYIYGGADENTSVGPLDAFFLLVDKPAVYNLPEKPHLPQAKIHASYFATAATAVVLGAFALASFFVARDGGAPAEHATARRLTQAATRLASRASGRGNGNGNGGR